MKQKSVSEFLTACRVYADKYIDVQRDEFKRLGILGEWDEPYKTMSAQYEADIIREIGILFTKDYVYRGKKPVLWCVDCATALAAAEVEYHDHSSPSVYIKFPMKDDLSEVIPELAGKNVYAVIWTTTPWTIPANLAITVHPDLNYVAAEAGDEVYLLAEYLSVPTLEACGIDNYKVIANYKGKILDKKIARHPFYDRDSVIILGDHVTLHPSWQCW